MSAALDRVLERVRALRPRERRALIAIAGPPASGKSTFAADLAAALGASACAVPMDGFHLDDTVLDVRGLRDRKGSPPSFDAAGFIHAMGRLAREPEVVLPVFDRSREIAIAGVLVVGQTCEIAVVEGNYLCFDAAPWRDLMALWDLSVFIEAPEQVLRDRLVERWQTHGRSEAATWIETNDIPNIRLVQDNRLPVDLTLSYGRMA